MPDLQNLLDDIDRLDQQATKGPWESLGPNIESADYTKDDVVSTDVDCSTYCYGGIGRGIQGPKNAEFIALARTALPQLAEALRAALEWHQPFQWSFGYGPVTSCKGCADQGLRQEETTYPCPTVQAIHNALGGDDGD
ncbi:MAG: hypothetical protein HLX51_11805 [Micrococcaceae bacterium]|nr:hypothetical protein [Micrococcaceae bacterium]